MIGSTLLRARWIFPVAAAPIADGAIEIGPDGRIAALHRRAPRAALDLGDSAIVPGFINAHTHLEFSDLSEPLQPAHPFSDWIRALVKYRRTRGDAREAILRGLEECRRNGTSAIGEIATADWPERESSAPAPRAVVFREFLGLAPGKVAGQLEIARRFLKERGIDERAGILRGLSPHAPYSVHPQLFAGLIECARQARAPVTVHLAETEAELELLRNGTGELVELLNGFGEWRPGVIPIGLRPIDFLRRLAVLERVIVAHANYLDDEEIDFVAVHRNITVAYCPRTHAFFGHSDHPWRTLADRGGRIAIGTDGRGSNPDLSVWNELQFLNRRFPECDPALLLQMGTLNGACALGLDSQLGTIEPGKSAQGAVLRLGDPRAADPFDALFHPDSRVTTLPAD